MFSRDVTAAIMVSQSNETGAMLASQTNHMEVELFSHVNSFFVQIKICMAAVDVSENTVSMKWYHFTLNTSLAHTLKDSS